MPKYLLMTKQRLIAAKGSGPTPSLLRLFLGDPLNLLWPALLKLKQQKATSAESLNVLPCGTDAGETDTNIGTEGFYNRHPGGCMCLSGVTELQCMVTWHYDAPEQEKLHWSHHWIERANDLRVNRNPVRRKPWGIGTAAPWTACLKLNLAGRLLFTQLHTFLPSRVRAICVLPNQVREQEKGVRVCLTSQCFLLEPLTQDAAGIATKPKPRSISVSWDLLLWLPLQQTPWIIVQNHLSSTETRDSFFSVKKHPVYSKKPLTH